MTSTIIFNLFPFQIQELFGRRAGTIVSSEGTRFSSVFDNHRGEAACRPQYGPSRMYSSRGSKKIHEREGKHQLSVLQRSKYTQIIIIFFCTFALKDWTYDVAEDS